MGNTEWMLTDIIIYYIAIIVIYSDHFGTLHPLHSLVSHLDNDRDGGNIA